MKRDRKRSIRNYDIYAEFDDYQYYGYIMEKGRLKLDLKRLLNVKYGPLNEDMVKKLQAIPRKTVYFHPRFKERGCYMCNTFSDYIAELRDLWKDEFKQAIDKIKTPAQAGDDAFMANIPYGILDYEECDMVRRMESFRRENMYSFVIRSMYSQYIHYIGSIIEHATIRVLTEDGYDKSSFSRNSFYEYIKLKYGIDVTEIENFKQYDRFYKLWNFLKHNSLDTHTKLKEIFPEILADEEFKNGDYSLSFVKISEETITDALTGLESFFKSFCRVVFNEDPEEAKWNYDDYFLSKFYSFREDWINPLGTPDYI